MNHVVTSIPDISGRLERRDPAEACLPGRHGEPCKDAFGRTINYLRVSLTDMCNLRCVYCMPADMTFRPPAELLQEDELLQLIRTFAELGFSKIRYTGGEPTLRHNLPGIIREVAAMPGIGIQAMTTNGILLDYLARPLKEAGLRRVNVSIDTLDETRFRNITRWGNLRDVMEGIQAAERHELEVKLNCVVVRGFNDAEDVVELSRLTLERPLQVRYIEMMPFGSIHEFQREHIVSEDELKGVISKALGPLELQDDGKLDGEARVYRLRGAKGSLGFISSVTKPFCAGCSRVRLTADGKLRLCLLRENEVDLLSLVRDGVGEDNLKSVIRDAIWGKPWGHGLDHDEFATDRAMSEIGG